MTPVRERGPVVSRRAWLTGVLALGVVTGTTGCGPSLHQRIVRHADATGELAPNMYVAVQKNGRVMVAVNKAELGQGVTTLFATLVAEELDVTLASVDVRFADSLPEYRTSFFMHQTGGSTSTKETFLPLRTAAAAARTMLVAAAASDWGVPPSECTTESGVVRHRASGRAQSYEELTTKAARQPVPSDPVLKDRASFRLIGKRSHRVDGRAKVDGTVKYGLDVVVPGMVRALAIHPPVFGASPKRVHGIAKAMTRPGMRAVHSFAWGVAVVADKHWQALAAARDLDVEWSDGSLAGLDTEKLRQAVRTYDQKENGALARDDGNVDTVQSNGTHIHATYEVPFLAHAPMEPQNCTVAVRDRRAEVWAPCQAPTVVQEFVAEALDLHRDDVLVHTTHCGGGFGRRLVADYAAQAALVSKAVGRPVQLMWTRESDTKQGFYRPQTAGFMRGTIDKSGRAVALSAHLVGQPIALDYQEGVRAALPGIPQGVAKTMVRSLAAMFATNTVEDMFATEGIKQSPYLVANMRVAFTPISTKLPVGSWRSVGHSANGFVIESFVDELAHAAKVDPCEFRRRMLAEGSRARRVLDAVAKLSRWGTPLPAGVGRGIARHESFGTEVAEVAEVAIVDGQIRVQRVYAVVDCGVAVNPDVVTAQIEGAIVFGLSAALAQRITLVDGVVQQDNFDTFPALRMHECPEIIVQIMGSEEPPSGAGEPGLPPIAPAVANAIFAATGVRLRRLPLQQAWTEVPR